MENSFKNLENYRKGKEPLKNAVLQHPTGDKVNDFIKKNINREFWVIPFKQWDNVQNLKK
jgi:hypothetical protein